ncbi:MAG: phosphotransferase family protein [Pseudomonadota bacterium]
MNEEIRSLAATLPVLAGYGGPIHRLGGLTNRVYRLGPHILRIPGEGTAAYINRAHEAVAAAEAARVGASPALIHADADSGLMVTRFIEAVTMTPARFVTRPGAVARATLALRTLHRSDARFPTRFDLFAMIDSYLALLAPRDVALPQGYADVVAEAGRVRAALAAHPLPQAACHCDPLCENFLDAGGRMWLVDWEYSGMNDPLWDLGDLSVEAQFEQDQDEAMLTAYFDGEPRPADRGRVMIYKAMCDLLWTLWGLIQLADANPADDFRAYADTRFARCKALMATPDFARHLAAVARG